VGINPENVQCLQTKAAVLGKMGKEMESLAVLEEALSIDSTDLDLCTSLAYSYMLKGMFTKAIELYNKAIVIDGNDPSTYGNLGWAYYMTDNIKSCIEYTEKAILMKPDIYFARYNLGLAHLRSGNISEARKIYGELKKEAGLISNSDKAGAIKDLNDLRSKGNYVQEVKEILREFF